MACFAAAKDFQWPNDAYIYSQPKLNGKKIEKKRGKRWKYIDVITILSKGSKYSTNVNRNNRPNGLGNIKILK